MIADHNMLYTVAFHSEMYCIFYIRDHYIAAVSHETGESRINLHICIPSRLFFYGFFVCFFSHRYFNPLVPGVKKWLHTQ